MLRSLDGYKSVEKFLDKHMVEKKRVFLPFLTVRDEVWEQLDNTTGDMVQIVKPICFTNRIKDFKTFILEDRGIDIETLIKIGLDKGKGSLKFVLGLFSPHTDHPSQDYLIACVPQVDETYLNLMKILDICGIELIHWDFFCSDLKVTMLVLGRFSSCLATD